MEDTPNGSLPPLESAAITAFAEAYKSGKEISFVKIFEDGAKWKERQMLSNAVQLRINVSLPAKVYNELQNLGCKEGDKLLIIKQE